MAASARAKDLLRPWVQRLRRARQALSRAIRPWQPWDGVHHPVLQALEPWAGESDGTWCWDSIGVRTDPRYRPQFRPQPAGRVTTTHPQPYAPYFELVFVLDAVRATPPGARFEMVELGAGYGAWLAVAWQAAQRFGVSDVGLTGVEMVPRHVAWMREHLRNNGADPDAQRILHGAVGATDGEAAYRAEPDADFGQALSAAAEGERVPVWSLGTLLRDVERVSLIHSDIQGAEGPVFRAARDVAAAKVERLLISTHSRRVHSELKRRFCAAGFEAVYDFRVRARERTAFGDVQFLDGLLCLVNRGLVPPQRRASTPSASPSGSSGTST